MQKIIHQVWVGPYQMPARERGYVELMKTRHPDFTHYLWTDNNLPALPPFLHERFMWRMNRKDYAFAANTLRVYVIWLFGGIYLDVDTDIGTGFTGMPVESVDGFFRHHGNNDLTFSSDFLGLSKGHPLGWFMLENQRAPAYAFHPHWFGEITRKYFGLDKTAPHNVIREKLDSINIMYMPSSKKQATETGAPDRDHWDGHFWNRALFSWSKENREKFEKGLMV